MNKVITSRQAILEICKQIVSENGFQGLNIREVAKKSGISVGTVYNYYQTKSDLIVATIEEIWNDIMQDSKICKQDNNFIGYVENIFVRVQKGSLKYPQFFTVHSMSITSVDKAQGRNRMEKYFIHIKSGLQMALDADDKVKSNVFSDVFSKTAFIDFVFTNLITLLIKQEDSCKFLLSVIEKVIY